jgi:hypothetical protein
MATLIIEYSFKYWLGACTHERPRGFEKSSMGTAHRRDKGPVDGTLLLDRIASPRPGAGAPSGPLDTAARFLALLPAESLVAKVVQVELIHDTPHLEAKLGVMVVGVETVSAREDPNAIEPEISVKREQKMVIARA